MALCPGPKAPSCCGAADVGAVLGSQCSLTPGPNKGAAAAGGSLGGPAPCERGAHSMHCDLALGQAGTLHKGPPGTQPPGALTHHGWACFSFASCALAQAELIRLHGRERAPALPRVVGSGAPSSGEPPLLTGCAPVSCIQAPPPETQHHRACLLPPACPWPCPCGAAPALSGPQPSHRHGAQPGTGRGPPPATAPTW